MMYGDYTLIAGLSAVLGCYIRYINTWKRTGQIKIGFMIADIIGSAFTGLLAFWVITDYHLIRPSYAAVITCIIGNMGSRIFDIISYYLHMKYGVPIKYEKKDE